MHVEVVIPFQFSPDGHRVELAMPGQFVEMTESNAADMARQGYVREPRKEKAAAKKQYA